MSIILSTIFRTVSFFFEEISKRSIIKVVTSSTYKNYMQTILTLLLIVCLSKVPVMHNLNLVFYHFLNIIELY